MSQFPLRDQKSISDLPFLSSKFRVYINIHNFLLLCVFQRKHSVCEGVFYFIY